VVQRIGDAGPDGLLLPFVETFEGEGPDTPTTWLPEGWLNIDADGDEDTWFWQSRENTAGETETYMRSYSYDIIDGEDVPLFPDNWLITPAIYLNQPGPNELIELKIQVAPTANNPGFREERYEVLISTTDTDLDSFIMLWEETFSPDDTNWQWLERTLNITEYADETVFVAIRHHGSSNMDAIALNSVEIDIIATDPDPVLADLTLNVRMVVWEELGIFDPAEDFVDVAGTFNDWGGEELILTPLDDEFLTYTLTIPDLEVGETYFFKFRINGSWSDDTAEFPSGGPDREVTIVDGENIHTFWYNDDETTTVAEVMENAINLFPNPARNQVNITSGSNIMEVAVYNVAGQQVYRHTPENQNHIINLNDFNNGIYMVRILTPEGLKTMKLQVVK